MKTKSTMANGRSRSFTRRGSLLATLVGASALVFIQPVFAQSDYEGTPDPIGSTRVGPEASGDALAPSFYEPWNTPPSEAGPDLAPAPYESLAPAPSSIYVPPAPVGLDDVYGHPPVPASNLQLLPPSATIVRPGGGRLGGYEGGRLDGYAR